MFDKIGTLNVSYGRVYFLIKWQMKQVFFCEFCEISKSTFFKEHMRVAAFNKRQPHLKVISYIKQLFWNSAKFTRKHLRNNLFLKKSQVYSLLFCYSISFAKLFRTVILQSTCERLLLKTRKSRLAFVQKKIN